MATTSPLKQGVGSNLKEYHNCSWKLVWTSSKQQQNS